MGIYRVEKNKNYVVMNRTALNDERLTWKAKGIIAYMLSLPDDWTFYIEEIVKHAKDGEAAFRSGLKELKDYGYVKRFPVREGQRIKHWETVIYEVPQQKENSLDGENQQIEPLDSDSLLVDSLHVDSLDVENRGLLSIDSNQVLKPLITDTTNNNVVYSEIIDYLNEKAGTKYKASTKKTQNLIKARIKEKFTVDDFKTVIDKKCSEWLKKPNMVQYLRPETLFGTKFESYLNQQGGFSNAENDDARKFVEENGISF